MTELYQTDEEIEQLAQAFCDRTLDKSMWTHVAHLTVGVWHARKFNYEEAVCRMRSGIISYNLATGGENTGTAGYHETITLFWMDVICFFAANHAQLSLKDTCNLFLRSKMSDRNYPFVFYTRETLLSSNARTRFVPPDKDVILRDSVLGLYPLSPKNN